MLGGNFMSIQRLALLVLSCVVLVNCDGGGDTSGSPGPVYDPEKGIYVFEPDPKSYSGLVRELQNAYYQCGSGKECPEALGLMFMDITETSYSTKLAQCTGFLVDKDIVATNSHCIPDHVKENPKKCREDVVIRFKDEKVF